MISDLKKYLTIISQICNVISEGNFCGKSATVGSTTFGSHNGGEDKRGLNFRKPVGVAAIDITDLFTFKQGKYQVAAKELCTLKNLGE